MSAELATPRSRATELLRRTGVTVGAVALFLAGERVRAPLIDPYTFRELAAGGPNATFSPLMLGLTPFVAGFLLVEMLAVVVPTLAPLRHASARERRPLTRAACAVAVVVAAVQGWALALFLQSVVRSSFGHPVLDAGLAPALGFAATLVAGTLAIGGLATLVSRHGIGNGFAVLLAVAAAERLRLAAAEMVRWPEGSWSDASLLAALALAVVVPLVGVHIRRAARGSEPRVPLPTCGLVPLAGAAVVYGFMTRLAEWFPAAEGLVTALSEESWTLAFGEVALAAALALAFAHLFCPPDAVAAAFRRAAPEAADADGALVRRRVRLANRRSVALVTVLALVPIAAALLGAAATVGTHIVLDVAVLLALALDLEGEVRARAASGALVSARPLHRVYAVAPVREALAAAGIPAFARARRFRTLFQFFAPYAPVEILVPRERAAEAEEICARVAGDPLPEARG